MRIAAPCRHLSGSTTSCHAVGRMSHDLYCILSYLHTAASLLQSSPSVLEWFSCNEYLPCLVLLFELVGMVPAMALDRALCPAAGCNVCSKLKGSPVRVRSPLRGDDHLSSLDGALPACTISQLQTPSSSKMCSTPQGAPSQNCMPTELLAHCKGSKTV